MRLVRVLVVLLATALLAAAGPPDPAKAGGDVTVTAQNMSFSPEVVTVALGDEITWKFVDITPHTTTSNQKFWDSGQLSSGAEWSRVFTSAGTFPYVCTPHATHMRGKVVVPFRVTGGSKTTGWKLRWATGAAAEGLAYDVEYRRNGTSTWRALRTDSTKPTGLFNPARDGRYLVRARTSNLTDARESGWSPAITVAID